MQEHIWAEKYRPSSFEDYVAHPSIQARINEVREQKNFPHILMYGPAGVGKSSLIALLRKEIGILDEDYHEINSSLKNGVDFVRDELEYMASGEPFGPFRLIVLEEADKITPEAWKPMKRIMEVYSHLTRFILTTNEPHKIPPEIKSRCSLWSFTDFHSSKDEILERLFFILVSEGVTNIDPEAVSEVLDQHYPDIRGTINALQGMVKNNSITKEELSAKINLDYMISCLEKKDVRAVDAIIKDYTEDQIGGLFSAIAEALPTISIFQTVENFRRAVIVIVKYMNMHNQALNKVLNVRAMMMELME